MRPIIRTISSSQRHGPNLSFKQLSLKIYICDGLKPGCSYKSGDSIWYTGIYPPFGTVKGRVLAIASYGVAMSFPKQGKGSASCNKPEEAVFIPRGGKLGPVELKQIYGAETPTLPIPILGCLQEVVSTVPQEITLHSTYQE